MAIKQHHYNKIRADLEVDKGRLLRFHLINKRHLIEEHLNNDCDTDHLDFKAQSFTWYEWSNRSTSREDGFVIRLSFVVTGDLIFFHELKENSRKRITLDIIAEVNCTYYASSDDVVYIPEQFNILTGDRRKICAFDEIVYTEFEKLSILRSLSTDLYDKTWGFNEPGNKMHEFISSMGYYYELEGMNRQAKYFIALANTYGHYANDYFPQPETRPFIHYPLNFTSHDRRYLDYCTSAIHSMYVYWERIALLIYQYYKPVDRTKINEKNLSFARLMKQIINEQQGNGIDLDWFSNFLKADHAKLQLLRHPLVHYQLDESGFRGSYIAMIHQQWIMNTRNWAELEQIENFSKKLIGEIIELAKKCYDGYEKAIQLIIDLRSNQT